MEYKVRPKCLIVDDDVSFLVYLKVLLEQLGFEVKHTTSVLLALKCLNKENYNLIISDIEMPDVDGLEFIQLIKTDKKLSEIPFIFLTNIVDSEIVNKAFNLGANGYIRKPYLKRYLSELNSVIQHKTDKINGVGL